MDYRLGTYALKKSDRLFVSAMLELASKRLQADWRIDDQGAELIIVDLDSPEGVAFWRLYADKQNLLGFGQRNIWGLPFFLEKPLRVQQMITVFSALELRLSQGRPITSPSLSRTQDTVTVAESDSRNSAPPRSSSSSDNNYYNPNQYLTGLLLNSLETEKNKLFRLGNLPALLFLPSERRCFTRAINFTRISNSQKIFCAAKVHQLDIQELGKEALLALVKQEKLESYPVETLLWLAVLGSSNGRHLSAYHTHSLVRLKEWPNFAVLPHEPEHMVLAAFMVKHSASVTTIAEQTRVEVSSIINFINACFLLNLVSLEQKETTPVRKRAIAQEKRSLFRNILRRLLR